MHFAEKPKGTKYCFREDTSDDMSAQAQGCRLLSCTTKQRCAEPALDKTGDYAQGGEKGT